MRNRSFSGTASAFDFAELVRGDLKREFLALMDAKKIILPQVTDERGITSSRCKT